MLGKGQVWMTLRGFPEYEHIVVGVRSENMRVPGEPKVVTLGQALRAVALGRVRL